MMVQNILMMWRQFFLSIVLGKEPNKIIKLFGIYDVEILFPCEFKKKRNNKFCLVLTDYLAQKEQLY